jgi:hypothetical protein
MKTPDPYPLKNQYPKNNQSVSVSVEKINVLKKPVEESVPIEKPLSVKNQLRNLYL